MADTPTGPGQRAAQASQRYTTRPRQAVLDALSEHGEFGTVQDLNAMREAGHRVGLSTVYRTLSALVAAAKSH